MHSMRALTSIATGRPGLQPAELCEDLDDQNAARLLPTGSFKLITTLRPELVTGPQRAETLGRLLSLELAVDDPSRRAVLLDAVPLPKTAELESRVGASLDELRGIGELDHKHRRALLGFFGFATVTERPAAGPGPSETVATSRALFPHRSGPRAR